MSQPRAVPRPPALVVTGVVLFGFVCGIGGWLIGADAPAPTDRAAFVATVDRVDADGLRGCLKPVERGVADRLGGAVCGRIFLAAGTDATPDARVRVRWFTTEAPVGGGQTATVESFVLEPTGRTR